MSSKLKHWISAARLRTIPLSISGIFIGSFAAVSDKMFNVSIFLLAILTSICYQILSNFANDYGDGVKGTDENRIGPKRMIQSNKISTSEMKKGIFILFIISVFLTFSTVFLSLKNNFAGMLFFILLGLLAITAAIKYTIGKNAYGYIGFGDFFVFLFFGLVSVLGSYYLFTSSINYQLITPACTVGLLSAGVLNLNNMRDINNDRKSQKKTMAVKLGPSKSKLYHFFLIISSVFLMLFFLYKLKSPSTLLIFLIIVNVSWLIHYLYKISKITNPIMYDKFLKPLGLSTFFYALILSMHFYKIL
jgi:1,4-dihydroxy-2-naphthoate octaprenyltransferase